MTISTRLVLLSLAASLCGVAACTETAKPADVPDAAARRELFENLAERVIAPTYDALAKSANTLAKASERYAMSRSAEDLSAAQAAFVDTMLIWERAEMFQVGPSAVISDATPGGKGLGQQIYAWGKVNHCSISRALVEETYADDKAFAQVFPDARGLGALEILLFDASTDSGCPKTNTILTSGAWDKLTPDELVKRRALFARTAAADLVERVAELEKAFRAFVPELAKAGAGSALFALTQDALNALSDAMFYLDTDTKDMKLAIPLGLTDSCTGKACLVTVPHPFAKISRQAIQANLEAFADLYRGLSPTKRGTEMWGIRDLLLSVSADDLVKAMDELLDASLRAISKVESLEDALAAGEPGPMQAYMALQSLTDRLKTDFLAVLALKAPMRAASDND